MLTPVHTLDKSPKSIYLQELYRIPEENVLYIAFLVVLSVSSSKIYYNTLLQKCDPNTILEKQSNLRAENVE